MLCMGIKGLHTVRAPHTRVPLGGGAALPMCLPGTMHPITPINRMVSGLVEIYMYLEKNAVKMLRRMNG